MVGTDTTNPSGTFHFNVAPGTYVVTLSDPPYTAPAPYTAVVVINKTLTLPDRIFTGAFAVSGTVVSQGNVDSLAGATVTLASKTDPGQRFTRVTDVNGYFSFGAKAGDSTLSVAYNGQELPVPVPVTVSASTVLPNLIFSTTISIRPAFGRKQANPWTIPGVEGYDARGAQRPAAQAADVRLYRIDH